MLPEPSDCATLLREKSLAIVEQWTKLYGENDKRVLDIEFLFLRPL